MNRPTLRDLVGNEGSAAGVLMNKRLRTAESKRGCLEVSQPNFNPAEKLLHATGNYCELEIVTNHAS